MGAWHSGEVILLVGLQSYDAHLSVTLKSTCLSPAVELLTPELQAARGIADRTSRDHAKDFRGKERLFRETARSLL